MIICKPLGGLNNRIKCLLSTMRVEDDIKLVWPYATERRGLQCSFSDLFSMPYETFFSLEECQTKYKNLEIYSDFKFIQIKEDIDINHLDRDYGSNWTKYVPEEIKVSYIKVISKLKPIPYIQDQVNKYKQLFNKDTITFAIRTYLDEEKNKISMGQHFDINRVFSILDQYKDKTFFITCDHQETFDKILNKYKSQVIYTPKRTFFGDYNTVEGTQDSVIDLYLGGLNDLLISSMGSSYCEMQWWFGKCKSKIKVVNLHSNQDNLKGNLEL